jgi:prefoldin subunit 5
MSNEGKEPTAKFNVREWIFITGGIITMLGGIGGGIGHQIFSQGDTETKELKDRIQAVEKANIDLWRKLDKLDWEITNLQEQQQRGRR